MSKSIVLYGDLIQDINLLEQPLPPSFLFQTLPHTVQITTEGGVAYLKKLLEVALSDCKLKAPQLEHEDWEQGAAKVFQTWARFPESVGSKKKVWRVSKLIGRSDCATAAGAAGLFRNTPGADILVIDSLGMGFLGKELMWKDPGAPHLKETEKWKPLESLVRKVNPKDIVFKLSSFRDGLPLPLPSDLLDRLTVILSVKALRERGADISEGISWDKTIEDTVREFTSGLSRQDLALCRRVVVLFSTEGAAVFEKEDRPAKKGADPKRATLKKFIYHPSSYEGTFKAQHPGNLFGDLSIITAAMLRHLTDPDGFPLFVALCLGLSAVRTVRTLGISEPGKEPEKGFDIGTHLQHACDVLALPYTLKQEEGYKGATDKEEKARKKQVEDLKKQLNGMLNQFACTFCHSLLHDKNLKKQKDTESNLLRDTTGFGIEYVAAKASEIVTKGMRAALMHVPVVSYGKFLTADREEIERINSIRKLITAYMSSPGDSRPLSIAVFGPPGAGKSFAIKQLADELGFEKKLIHEFNLSQFRRDNIVELHTAFHQVRDASMKGKIPLVFWDEFDTGTYEWLKDFLAPMQDSEFRVGSVTHPFNKAIFIFAGGVTETFQQLDARKHEPKYKALKVPDFISRLRGYVNIKGPNKPDAAGRGKNASDPNFEYLIRRAILLRSILERSYGHLIADDGTASISMPVVQAFLRAKRYIHGARSLEALLSMCSLADSSLFGESCLPVDELMDLHVEAKEFRSHLKENTLEQPMIELIAASYHEAWCETKKGQGYALGEKRCDEGEEKTHPLIKPYSVLNENEKEGNRITARLTRPKLHQVGLKLVWGTPPSSRGPMLKKYYEELIRIEHDIWLRDHLLGGYEYAEKTDDLLRLHKNMALFDDLEEDDKDLDKAIIKTLEDIFSDRQCSVKKIRGAG